MLAEAEIEGEPQYPVLAMLNRPALQAATPHDVAKMTASRGMANAPVYVVGGGNAQHVTIVIRRDSRRSSMSSYLINEN
ncbi:hypothetical protein K0651_07095 [Ornithinimicrobium sp. Arc0846-15]|nr:hypothetical protein [Ornithinimicrobium laminariae]